MQIPLDGGYHAYGQMLDAPEYAFFDCRGQSAVPIDQVVSSPVLFRLWVMAYAHKRGRWSKIGVAQVPKVLVQPVQRFNQDALTGKIRLTYDGCDGPEATIDECEGVECAAVWDPEHVEDRLRDHYLGVRNRWADSLRPR